MEVCTLSTSGEMCVEALSLRRAGEQLKNFLTILYISYAHYMGSWYHMLLGS